MNLVSDQTGLRDMVNIDGLVDTGSGDSNSSRDSRGSSIGSNRGSMGNSSYRGSMSYSSNSRGSSIGQSMSGKDTVSSQTNSKIAGISISSGGSHGGTQQG